MNEALKSISKEHFHNISVANVYTDGSVNVPKKQSSAAVFWEKDHPLNTSIKLTKLSSNFSELVAALLAIKIAQVCGIKKLEVNSDSAYVADCWRFLQQYKSNGWKDHHNKSVENSEILKHIEWCSKDMVVSVTKVHRKTPNLVSAHKMAYKEAKSNF